MVAVWRLTDLDPVLLLLHQFLANPFPFQFGDMIHEQLAVQVIQLVLNADRQDAVALHFEGFTFPVQGLEFDGFGAGDGFIVTGH